MEFLDILKIIGIVLGVALILGFLVSIIMSSISTSSYNGLSNEVTDLKGSVQKLQRNIRPGTLGPQGPAGPTGPRGPAGGTFQMQGPLRNLSKVHSTTDRMYGLGPQSIAYLNEPNFRPHQYWTLNSDMTLANHYGGCLQGDAVTGNVYMARCNNTSNAQRWRYDTNGRLQLNANPEKCLTTTFQNRYHGMPDIVNNRAGKSRTHTDLVRLKLETCDNQTFPVSQLWAFY